MGQGGGIDGFELVAMVVERERWRRGSAFAVQRKSQQIREIGRAHV